MDLLGGCRLSRPQTVCCNAAMNPQTCSTALVLNPAVSPRCYPVITRSTFVVVALQATAGRAAAELIAPPIDDMGTLTRFSGDLDLKQPRP
ncbi:hypothetical protein BAUCODRAFT_126746 [Baudoinia panamericana UAMH 10762]|uniref:Uncharacterized protein n=1 Tax=Baudoinia panamericana (strain UAMH 10762) TaxID=717646 RepID=M2MYK9_BAUPA|nr:uncharacterized protein BAUCODRAFT_126746 [Baudoinia panamericana UAMH 10762]EMC91749.1 hypothetical protein BAUCODRAFT_126746 [Baudoinia panamericana UAMH 10762]